MNRVLKVILLSLFIIAILIVGSIGNNSVNTSDMPTESVSPSPHLKQKTLRLWHIWATDSDSNKIPFQKALEKWNNENPDIQITTEATESETYKIKIRTAIAVNEAPDIFFAWGAGFAKPFVDAGKVLALDNYLDENIFEKLEPEILKNFTYDDKIYGLPTFMIAGIFYCNTELFEKYKVKIPETYDELLEAVKSFRENNITPIAIGLKDGWPGIFYQNILAIRTAGIEKCIAALSKETSFFQPEFIESAERLITLIDTGAFHERCIQFTQHEAELMFLNGRVPMYYGGSWAAGSMDSESCPVKGKVAIRNFPVIEGASGDPNGFLGGAIDSFMISSSTVYKKDAVKALTSILEDFCKESYLAGAGIPAWKVEIDKSTVNPLAVEISNLLEDRDGFVLAWDTFLSGSDAETHINLVTDLFLRRIDAKEFAIKMQQLNMKNYTWRGRIYEKQIKIYR